LFPIMLAGVSAGFPAAAGAQEFTREFTAAAGSSIEIVNIYGRVGAAADIDADAADAKGSITARGASGISESDLVLSLNGRNKRIEVKPGDKNRRIDIIVKAAKGVELKIHTAAGEVRISGEPAKAE